MVDPLQRDMLRRDFYVMKDAVPCMIMTTKGIIEGNIHKRAAFRFKDELNQEEHFIAITDATIFSSSSNDAITKRFLAIRAEQIVWVAPSDEAIEEN